MPVDDRGIAWELYSYAKRVAAGEVEDPTFLPVLLEPPEGFDWRDPEVWGYVNPALGVFRSYEEMATSAKRAEHVPAQQAAFRQLYLNEWRDGSAAPWLDLAVWDEGAIELEPDQLDPGSRCWIGVDLASTADLAAAVAVFEGAGGHSTALAGFALKGTTGAPLDDGVSYLAIPKFYCPAEASEGAASATASPIVSGPSKAILRPPGAR